MTLTYHPNFGFACHVEKTSRVWTLKVSTLLTSLRFLCARRRILPWFRLGIALAKEREGLAFLIPCSLPSGIIMMSLRMSNILTSLKLHLSLMALRVRLIFIFIVSVLFACGVATALFEGLRFALRMFESELTRLPKDLVIGFLGISSWSGGLLIFGVAGYLMVAVYYKMPKEKLERRLRRSAEGHDLQGALSFDAHAEGASGGITQVHVSTGEVTLLEHAA